MEGREVSDMKLADASKPILVGSMLWLSSCEAVGTDRANRGLPTFKYRDVEGCGDLLVHASRKLRISLTGFKAPADGMPQETYWAHVRLEFAEFQDQHGSLVWHDAPIDLDAEVGWMSG
jgi:hypothetical protein